MRREGLLSVGAVALAALGTQHHNLMMVLLALGVGGAGMSVMADVPLLRDAMLATSLVMAIVVAYQVAKPSRPVAVRVAGALSILLTLGLAGWSVVQLGL